MTATDVQKILNLKHAWEFILDRDVIASRSDYYMLSHIARVVNEGFLRKAEELEEFRLLSEVLHMFHRCLMSWM